METLPDLPLQHSSEMEYAGNFVVKYRNKKELELLQSFFGVRRSKFDMALLDKRPALLAKLRQNEDTPS